jgi:hypothetical protein
VVSPARSAIPSWPSVAKALRDIRTKAELRSRAGDHPFGDREITVDLGAPVH